MIASELISYDIPPLKLSDNGTKAMDWMEEFKTTHLPVVNDNIYVGLISEMDVLDRNNLDDPINQYNLTFNKLYVKQDQHFFEVISVIVENELNLAPVINSAGEYLGVITTDNILKEFSKTIAVSSAGSIVTLEMNLRDYSLAEIAKLVESNDAKILASFVTSHSDSTKLEVTLKINTTDISRILHTFERFEYNVLASYNESEYHQDLKDRFDEFMRFLNP